LLTNDELYGRFCRHRELHDAATSARQLWQLDAKGPGCVGAWVDGDEDDMLISLPGVSERLLAVLA